MVDPQKRKALEGHQDRHRLDGSPVQIKSVRIVPNVLNARKDLPLEKEVPLAPGPPDRLLAVLLPALVPALVLMQEAPLVRRLGRLVRPAVNLKK